jgi:hypothetical protein
MSFGLTMEPEMYWSEAGKAEKAEKQNFNRSKASR